MYCACRARRDPTESLPVSSSLRRGCCPNRAELLAGCVAPSVSCDAALVEKAIVEGCDSIGLHSQMQWECGACSMTAPMAVRRRRGKRAVLNEYTQVRATMSGFCGATTTTFCFLKARYISCCNKSGQQWGSQMGSQD